MANTTPQNPATTPLKQPGFAFPFRKKGQGNAGSSAEFTDEHEFYKVLKQEPSGSYSVSGKGMWHGGIHVTEAGAGGLLDLKNGVRCIADGEVVAWRVNQTYPVSEIAAQNGHPAINAPYSTGFALVRHSMEFPKGTTLKFFSLYMHLQDLEDYDGDTTLQKPAYWSTQFKVTEFARDKPHAGPNGQAAAAGQQGLRVHATKIHGTILGILPQGAQVSIGKREGDWGQITDTHGAQLIAQKVGGFVAQKAVNGWMFLGKENGGPVVEEVMPDSSLDCVVVPPTPFPVKAGDLIGHLGRYDSLSQQTSTRMVHIEVFCDDSVKSSIDQGRAWISNNGAHAGAWTQVGLPSAPTILRIDKGTALYKAANQQGQDAKQTGVIQVLALAELAKLGEDGQHMETEPGPDGLKLHWWKVDSADVHGHDISGWVREQNFAGGRVTREFAQKWVDFQILEDAHDPTHTMFATTKAFVDYAIGRDVSDAGALGKLSPLMTSIYRTLYPTGDGSRAADDLCVAADDPWIALCMSRLIVKHESDWANPDKWKQLIAEIEKQTGPQAQHEEEQKRIGKLVWWDDVKAGLPDLPASDVFHIHPVGLVGNFQRKFQLITLEMLLAVDPSNSREYYGSILPHLNKYAKIYGLTRPKRIAHLLSQAAHESNFKTSEERLNYGPQNMRKTFGCKGGKKNYNVACDDCTHGRLRDKLWGQESYYSHNPEHLANYVYADRMGNGDESSGEGFKYRGRGIIQVTGKDGYQSFQDEHNRRSPDDHQDFVGNPGLVSSNLGYGVESAFVFWSRNNLNSEADTGTVETVTQIVNGGQNGYVDRLHRFNSVAPLLGLSKE
jgi:predicted chitinase